MADSDESVADARPDSNATDQLSQQEVLEASTLAAEDGSTLAEALHVTASADVEAIDPAAPEVAESPASHAEIETAHLAASVVAAPAPVVDTEAATPTAATVTEPPPTPLASVADAPLPSDAGEPAATAHTAPAEEGLSHAIKAPVAESATAAELPVGANPVPASASTGSRPASARITPGNASPVPHLPSPPPSEGVAAAGAGVSPRPRQLNSARTSKLRQLSGPVHDPAQFVQAFDPQLELPASVVPTTHLLSLDAHRRNNLWYIEEDVLVMAAGNRVVFLKLPLMTQTYLPGLDGGGVGAIAVHPSRRYLAVAEKCRHRSPNVYVYSYPELELVCVMQGGTERAYSALAFNEAGDQLATVGSHPDYLLTLWRWEDEAIVLRSKAFSQEVYTVRFSPYFAGNLTSSGTGHIRFWKMASTFTGLKLQGQIGKFGNVELSDIGAFVEMPDGKVLSSTETGDLLMWDGGLVKVVLQRPNNRPCHDGQVHVLMHDRGSNTIVSGGSDGWVRLWDFTKVNEAEPDEDCNTLAITPVDEVQIAPGAQVRSLVWERRHWLVLDGSGALLRVELPQAGALAKGATVTRLLEFHAGGITGLTTSPIAHVAITSGSDGSVRVFDYEGRRQLHSLLFGEPATCLVPVGSSCVLVVAGFADGVVRAVMRMDGGLRLRAAFKPHKGAVTAVAVNSDSSRLASCGEDGTLFLFDVDAGRSKFQPLCFFKLPAVATCMAWSLDGARLILGLRNGNAIEVHVPGTNSVDTSKTYEASLAHRLYAFNLPKPKVFRTRRVPVTEADVAAALPAEGAVVPTEGQVDEGSPAVASKSATTEDIVAVAASQVQSADGVTYKEVEEEVEDDGMQDEELMEVLTISYAPVGSSTSIIHLSLSGRAAGAVWQCDMDAPASIPPMRACAAPTTAPTSCVQYSRCGRLQLLGTTDGVVRVQPLAKPLGYAEPAGRHWQACLHDMQDGSVSGMALSFDGAYLLSAARDGTLYLQEMHIPGVSPSAASPSAREQLLAVADAPAHISDITNPSEYTLEEAKQKAEQDALVAAAEAKKMGVRDHLKHIRSEFEALLAENDAKPEAERLPRSAFEIDPGLREMVAEETARREEAARKELAWDTEKRRLAVAKLSSYFLDMVEVERIVLHAVNSKQCTTTFRTARLSDELLQELADAKEGELDREEALSNRNRSSSTRLGASVTGEGTGIGPSSCHSSATAAGLSPEDQAKLTKADVRRLARKQREAAWATFNATRPDDKYENPADVTAIEEAERNMGDFKLKSDPAYSVPEAERMTPQRKRFQMLLLEETMHGARMDFNHRFLALRDVKRKVVTEINGRVAQLSTIAEQLTRMGGDGGGAEVGISPKLLAMQSDEVPEDRDQVSDADVEEYLNRKAEEGRKATAGSALGGFATGGGAKAAVKPSTTPAPVTPPSASPVAGTSDDPLSRIMAAVPLSDLERQLQAFHRKRLLHRRTRLCAEIQEMAGAFDDALSSLRAEKFRLESELKMCEIRQLVHAQELALLSDFDKREVVLIQKRTAKLDDRGDILEKISDCSSKLESKRAELEGLMAKRAAVAAQYDAAVPDSNPFREALSKVFYRRIKRNKKKAASMGNLDDDSEGDSDSSGDEEGDDDDDGGEEVCPQGCDVSIYERVCDLREKRLDEEDLVADFSKTIDALRKDKESLAKKQKLVEQGLSAINSEINTFQQEKQAALNQIDVVVNLHIHQVEYLIDGRLPDDLSSALVFSSTQLERLRSRIDELEDEKTELRQRQKTLKKEHLQLLKDKAAKEARVAELEARAHDVQMLKFGQEVDLELLDALGASRGTEELRAELGKQEASHALELALWDAKIAARTEELMALTRENTAALNAVCGLTSAQRGLEIGLTTTRKTMFADPVTQRRQEVEERDGLVQLVNAQAKELERLRAQVMALRRKDTSVYS